MNKNAENMSKGFVKGKIASMVLAGILVFTACDDHTERDARLAEAEARIENIEALEMAVLVRDSMLDEMVTAFDKVDMNLEVIREKEESLREFSEGEEVMGSHQDRIVRDIQVINTLMSDNKKEIAKLQKRLRTSGANNSKLKARLDRMVADNEAKDGQISELREMLLDREQSLAGLNDTLTSRDVQLAIQKDLIDQQALVLNEQDQSLNEAYFAIGTLKELKNRGLVERKGGLFGLVGGHHEQNIALKTDEFIRIDQRDHQNIPVFAKKVEFVTPHPDDSYELNRDEEGHVSTINITDPEAFWESSRYLIVATD